MSRIGSPLVRYWTGCRPGQSPADQSSTAGRLRDRAGSPSKVLAGLDSDTDDAVRVDAEHLLVEPLNDLLPPSAEHLGRAADLDHAWAPGVGRCQVVDHEGHPRVVLHIAILF